MNFYNELRRFYGDFEFNYFVHISLKNKIVYFEIPKTGCTTIKNILCRFELDDFSFMLDGFDDSLVHLPPYSSVLLRPFNFTPEEFNRILNSSEFFKFAMVRDPLERLVSSYYDKVFRNSHEAKDLVHYLISKGADLHHYLVDENPLPINIFVSVLREYKNNNLMINSHFRSQLELLPVNIVSFDKIYNFSKFEAEIGSLMEKLNKFSRLRVYGSHAVDGKSKLSQLDDDDRALLFDFVEGDYEIYEKILSK